MILWFTALLIYLTIGYFYACLVESIYKVEWFSVSDVVTIIVFWWVIAVINKFRYGKWI